MNKHQIHTLTGRKPWKNNIPAQERKLEIFLQTSSKENPELYMPGTKIEGHYSTPTLGERLRRS